jgi:predicted XRE-type DNA-binding protein
MSVERRRGSMHDAPDDEIPLVTKEEAVAEVRRWLEVEKVDPEKIFAVLGDTTIRYKDLMPHLEQETPDGKLLLFAISRGRLIKKAREQEIRALLDIAAPPPKPQGPAAT